MNVKYVNEFLEEMCDICYKYDYGIFVEVEYKQICEKCCNKIQKSLQVYELTR